jgi:hypothetical protein
MKINRLSDITLAPGPSNCQSVTDIWKKHLHWPKMEEKKNSKKVKNIMPFALISKEWKEYHDEKEKKKTEQIVLKEERKQYRKRKAEEKNKARLTSKNRQSKKNVSNNDSYTSSPKERDSYDEDYEIQDDQIQTQQNQLEYEVNDFVIVRYDKKYFPGKIIQEEDEEYEVTTMVQSEKGKVWKWPELPDTVWYKRKDVLTKIAEPKKVNSRGFFVITELNKYKNIV